MRENPDLAPVKEERDGDHHPAGKIVIELIRDLPANRLMEDACQRDACDIRQQGNRDRAKNQDDPVKNRAIDAAIQT